MTKALLNRDAILNAKDLKTIDVEVPEWGGTVRVSQIYVADKQSLQSSLIDEDGKILPLEKIGKIMTLGLLAKAIVDENGERLFTEDDIEALGKKSASAIERVFAAANELNGMTQGVADNIQKK